jgi:hypothetical protein
MVGPVLRQIRGALVSGREQPIELEVLSDRLVITPGLARLLMVLARRQIEWERAQKGQSDDKESAA